MYSKRLSLVEGLGNGLLAFNSSGTPAAYTMTSSNGVSLTNPAGGAGAPAIALNSSSFSVDLSNRVNFPAQPYFSVYKNADSANVTGDGTGYQIPFNATIYSTGTGFDTTTGTFSLPATGRYLVLGSVGFDNIGAGHTSGYIQIVANGLSYIGFYANPANMRDPNNICIWPFHTTWLGGSSSTMVVNLYVFNSTKTINVRGNSNLQTCVNIYMLG